MLVHALSSSRGIANSAASDVKYSSIFCSSATPSRSAGSPNDDAKGVDEDVDIREASASSELSTSAVEDEAPLVRPPSIGQAGRAVGKGITASHSHAVARWVATGRRAAAAVRVGYLR